jgi:hypothetical protein
VRGIRVWARLLGLRRAVVEGVETGNEGEVIVSARVGWRERDRCGVCPALPTAAWINKPDTQEVAH